MKLSNKYLLSGDELSSSELNDLLELGVKLKRNRYKFSNVLCNKHLALIFDKPSLRTRMSFIVAMHELGGHIIESVVETRKSEEPEDQIRVLQGYCHAVMLRLHEDDAQKRMHTVATIPVINGLSELYHPCQTLADLMTLKEKFTSLQDLNICYLGDGNNILHSLLLMAPKIGVKVHYCCPNEYQPNADIVKHAKQKFPDAVIKHNDPESAVLNCQAVYTDVWTSMKFTEKNETAFEGFQVNESLMKKAAPDAVFMHCMPMLRGKEVSKTLPDQPCSVIFQQSENRMHMQKALLMALLG
ncbi:MAG: ornithine carbamoyltransferase [Proteobacteria bacterium]|nr:ornithine carbamoyltransferase [Pseudomonadota bacterium]